MAGAASDQTGQGNGGDQSTGTDQTADQGGEQSTTMSDDGSGGNGDDMSTPTEDDFDLKKLRVNVTSLQTLVDSLLKTTDIRQANVKATPREDFRDRQAYRAELRNALAEVELDDAHDLGQNSLYRLQFHATVLPGAHQRQMGVARLTLEPPELSQDDVLELYKTWLGHVTYRLNQPAAGSLQHDQSYLLMGMGLERSLFHSTNLKVREGDPDVFVALPPSIYAEWKQVTERTCTAPGMPTNPNAPKACTCLRPGAAEDCPDLEVIKDKIDRALRFVRAVEEDSRKLPALGARCEPHRCSEAHKHWQLLQDLAAIEPFMSASLRGLGDLGSIDTETASYMRELIKQIVDGADTLDRLRYRFLESCRDCREGLGSAASTSSQAAAVPKSFREAVVRPCADAKAHCRPLAPGIVKQPLGVAHGGADVYATAPVELAQQISTTSSAVRSFESAVALAASLPTRGLKAAASLKRLRATRSDIEALERLPLVVGFAERRTRPPAPYKHERNTNKPCARRHSCEKRNTVAKDPDNRVDPLLEPWPASEDPQFGWVFGPQATLDGNQRSLRLRRPVVNYPVTVDLSIPGWWPRVRLILETAWVANWHAGDVIASVGNKSGTRITHFPVYLPLNRADLDGLTEYLAQKTVGGALPYTSIAAVSPKSITTCRDDVTFLVYGTNVWRSSVAYLNGLESGPIRVLPDMAGVAVTFTGLKKGLPQIPSAGGKARLTLWTRNGASSKEVTVVDPKAAGLACGQPEKSGLKLALARHALIGPERSATGNGKGTKNKKDKKGGDAGPKTTGEAAVRIIQGALPPGYYHLGIFARPTKPLTDGAMREWSPKVDKTATPDEEKAGDKTVHVVKGPLDLSMLDLETGDTLQISFVVTPAPRAEGKRYPVDGKLVFYEMEEEAQIQVKTTSLKVLDTIDLLLPYRYDIAYPDLHSGKATFGIETDSLGAYTLSFENTKPTDFPKGDAKDDKNRLLHLHLELTKKDGSEVKDEERTKFLESSHNLTVTLRGGAELPKVQGTVMLYSKKK